jgi:hypothetical protein
MIKDILVNKNIPVSEVGKRFRINKENSFDGIIILSAGELSDVHGEPLGKNKYNTITIPEMIHNDLVKFIPKFIRIETAEDIKTVTIEIL